MRASLCCLALFASLLPVSATPQAQTPDTASVEQFFASIYRSYHRNGKGIDALSPVGAKFFDASFRALMRADAHAAGPGEVGVLDFDPLCACQDWDDVSGLSVSARAEGTSHTSAGVSFKLAPSGSDVSHNLEFTLVRVAGGWRIHNVIDRTDAAKPFDLRAALIKELDESKRHPAAK
ncbi:MAG: DUF3828 domain-containing protein [Terracidiphilus sp.]|nr:DUF3828 domain-containing protein [Terracidiphilus sp.]